MDSFEKAALPRGLPQARGSYTGTPMGKWTLLTVPQRGRSPGLSQIPSIQDLWQIRKALQWPRPSTAGQADTNPTVKCRQRLWLLLASRKEASLCAMPVRPCLSFSCPMSLSQQCLVSSVCVRGVCVQDGRLDLHSLSHAFPADKVCTLGTATFFDGKDSQDLPHSDCNKDQVLILPHGPESKLLVEESTHRHGLH